LTLVLFIIISSFLVLHFHEDFTEGLHAPASMEDIEKLQSSEWTEEEKMTDVKTHEQIEYEKFMKFKKFEEEQAALEAPS